MQNIEIERKFFSTYEIHEEDIADTVLYKTSISHDRYYICPNGLIRLRDDESKGIEITAKTYKKDNLYRREINLGLAPFINIKDALEFADVAGWTLRLEFKQHLKIWITNTVCISQTKLTDLNDNPYRFSREANFITSHPFYPKAMFVEIEALDSSDKKQAIKDIKFSQDNLGLRNKDIIKYSLVQLFGAYPL